MTLASPSLPALGARVLRRKAVAASGPDLVRTRTFGPDAPLPLVVEPTVAEIDLVGWAAQSRGWLEERLLEHGALLFRGFGPSSPELLEGFIQATSSGEWAEYREAATPRSAVSKNIFTSTDFPPEQAIYLHNENSHCTSWPQKIYFTCVTAPRRGGATPIADCRQVYERLPPEVRQRFLDCRWMYVRNFGDGLGFAWQEVFGADDRDRVEDYCRRNRMVAEWKHGDRLRVRYVRPATAVHPKTGETVWFNHGTFFHVSTLPDDVREMLLSQVTAEDLPYQTYYGDGGDVEPETMDTLRRVYRECTVRFPWQEGDLLMLDNMLAAHGREPFERPRKILVGMAEPVAALDVRPGS
ncbi:MAG TPA: TauD/TfdA family dioxygenase [Thermoanaerobaculia bacterium]|jgi:alpha-ketoglutarate-dependent taurine dioxygenase